MGQEFEELRGGMRHGGSWNFDDCLSLAFPRSLAETAGTSFHLPPSLSLPPPPYYPRPPARPGPGPAPERHGHCWCCCRRKPLSL